MTHSPRHRMLPTALVALSLTASVTVATEADADAETLTEWGRRALNLQANLDRDVPLARTMWVGAHNSFANPDDDNLMDYNQPDSLKEQLRYGVRELVFDLHYTGDAIRMCHNNTSYSVDSLTSEDICTDGVTGNRKFRRGLDDIKAWIREGNDEQVVLLKLELSDSARRNINKVEDAIDDIIRDYTYRPDMVGYHGNLNADTGCTQLGTDSLSKQQVVEARKNVIIFTSHTCISDGGFNDVTFYAGNRVVDTKYAKLSDSSQISAADKNTILYRAKDGVTRDGELDDSGPRTAKMKPSNVADWMDAGLGIFELYGFGARNSSWNVEEETPVQPEHMVWSWAQYQPNTSSSSNDCAQVGKSTGFEASYCTNRYRFTCYSSAGGWSLSGSSGVWTDGWSLCPAGTSFRAPVNKPELEALRAVIPDSTTKVWINYTDRVIEGEWVSNASSKAYLDSRVFEESPLVGGSGGSWFTDFDLLVLDMYRSKRRVTKVEMSAGNRVDKIGFVYSDGHSRYHGGNSIDRSLTLATDEYLSKAEICIDKKNGSKRVFYLKFTTNNGRTLSGGSRKGSCSTASASGKELFAMRGRSGEEVDQLSFIMRAR